MVTTGCHGVRAKEIAGQSTASRQVLEDEAGGVRNHEQGANAAAVGTTSGCERSRRTDYRGVQETVQHVVYMWCLEEGKEGPCRTTGTCGNQAKVMLWQGPAVVGTGRLARQVAVAPAASWAPPAGVPSLRAAALLSFHFAELLLGGLHNFINSPHF